MEILKQASSLRSTATFLAVVGASVGLKKDRSKAKGLLVEFAKEFVSSLVLFVIFYIGCTYLAGYEKLPFIVGWLYHAACVVGLDQVSGGACMNPAISTGLWINGVFDSSMLLIHLAAQIFAGQYGFFILKIMAPVLGENLFSQIAGPNYSGLVNGGSVPLLNIPIKGLIHQDDVIAASILEMLIMFSLCVVIYYIQGRVQSPLTKVGIVAMALRFNMIFTENLTGACMNPMIAYSWLVFVNEGSNSMLDYYYQKDYIMVYAVAPMIGAAVAALVTPLATATDVLDKKAAPVAEKAKAAPTKSSRAASRGRSRARKPSPSPEPEPEPEPEEKEEEAEPKPAPKKASRSRSKSTARKAPSSTSKTTSSGPKRRTSSRVRK